MKSTWILVRKVSVEKDIMQLSRIYPLHPRKSCITTFYCRKHREYIWQKGQRERFDAAHYRWAAPGLRPGFYHHYATVFTTQLKTERTEERGEWELKIWLPKINSPLKTSFIVTHDYSPFCISLLSRVSTLLRRWQLQVSECLHFLYLSYFRVIIADND